MIWKKKNLIKISSIVFESRNIRTKLYTQTYISFPNGFKTAISFILKLSFMFTDFCRNIDYLSPSGSIAWTLFFMIARLSSTDYRARDKSAISSSSSASDLEICDCVIAMCFFYPATPRLIVAAIETNRDYWAKPRNYLRNDRPRRRRAALLRLTFLDVVTLPFIDASMILLDGRTERSPDG